MMTDDEVSSAVDALDKAEKTQVQTEIEEEDQNLLSDCGDSETEDNSNDD